MKEYHDCLLPLEHEWEPALMAAKIEREVEILWNDGWVFVEAKPDKLLESICLHFERLIFLELE